ncbi:unnamed protein product [Clonostachys byssicola]|uniref:Uncharacterized protein n=1 Tax=Clonostachys byssicola TaxID=160290 RepID=A0A9N9U9D7_9HYPO|nr:unnamed protein product [Clonostachys byssicola]
MPTVDDVIVNSGKMEEDGGSWDLGTTRVELDGHSSGMLRHGCLDAHGFPETTDPELQATDNQEMLLGLGKRGFTWINYE